MKQVLCLMFAGALGTLARYGLLRLIPYTGGGAFPVATVFTNVLGCLVIGILIGFNQTDWFKEWGVIAGVGFCGAFTTFSTFLLETTNLLKHQLVLKAFAHLAGSLILGIAAIYLGLWVASKISSQA